MKNIRENRTLIISGATLLVLIIAGMFYYFIVRPNQIIKNNELIAANYLKLSKQCKADSESNFEADKDVANSELRKQGVINCYYYDPQFIFNKELNTCLYSGGYTCDLDKIHKDGILKGMNVKQWNRHIVDVYTNKSIVQVYINDSSNVDEWTNEQITKFWEKSSSLGFQ